jgi:hypothetical protein
MKRLNYLTNFSLAGLIIFLFPAIPARSEEGNSDKTLKFLTCRIARSLAFRYHLEPPPDTSGVKRGKETWQVLRTYYTEMGLLNPESIAFQLEISGEKEPTPAQVQKMAKFISPLYQKAVEQVISENEKHLEDMEKSVTETESSVDDATKAKYKQKIKDISKGLEEFKKDEAETAKRLDRWKSGGFKPGEFSSIQVPSMFGSNSRDRYSPASLSFWDKYVKMFIEAFQLDAGQQSMVYSVVNDLKTKAKAYREDHKAEFVEISRASKQFIKRGALKQDDEKKYAELQKKKEKLEKPISDMFDDLKQRLMAIPTDDQRKSAQEVLGK